MNHQSAMLKAQQSHESRWHLFGRRAPEERSMQSNSRDAADLDEASGEAQDKHAEPCEKEELMPSWLVKVLKKGDRIVSKDILGPDDSITQANVKIVETPGVIPTLSRLIQGDKNIQRAVLCSPLTYQVFKLRREGSFCGYRNIQMMLSYVCNTGFPGYTHFENRPLPSVFELQELIEKAWRMGFNTKSRDQIGHVFMTRKFIGTPEVEALLSSLGIPIRCETFIPDKEVSAAQCLVEHVAGYFGLSKQLSTSKVCISQRPPIYLQRLGHSITIVGIEQYTTGTYGLIVFDPAHPPSKGIKKLTLKPTGTASSVQLLKHYRCSLEELAKHDVFEIVELDDHVTTQE